MSQNETNRDEEFELDLNRVLRSLLRALRRLWLPVLAFAILGAGLFLLYKHNTYVPEYKAYCSFAVRVVNKAATGEANSSFAVHYDKDVAEQLDKTFSYVLESDLLTDRIREYLGDTSVKGRVDAGSISGSNIFMLTAYGSTPQEAQRLLDAVMNVYMDAARVVIGDLESEIVEEPVVSDQPYNKPTLVKNFASGFMLGLIPGVLLVVGYAFSRRTVLVPEDLEQYVNMPCLGVVPLVNMKKLRGEDESDFRISSIESSFRESVRGIARKLETELKKRGGKVILVTGSVPGEGKSTTSQYLATTLASWGKKVVLVDGDLRKPDLARRFGIRDREMSLEKVLRGEKSLETVICHREKLALVANTVPSADATVVLGLPETEALIGELAGASDYVILDAPPCGRMADAVLLSGYADGIVYVVQQDRVPISRIAESASSLCTAENKLLGYILNGADEKSGGYGYGYGKYGYGRYGYGRYGYGRYGRYGDRRSEQKKNTEE